MAFDFNSFDKKTTAKKTDTQVAEKAPVKPAGFDFNSYGEDAGIKPAGKPMTVFGAAKDMAKGAAKGAGSTVIGLGELALKGYGLIPYAPGKELAKESIQTGEDIKKQQFTPENTAEKIGYGGEQIAEFFIPAGEAAKGIKAVEAGAEALNLGSKATKVLKLAGKAGIGAVEAGGVRAAQTGGDPKETATAAAFGAVAPLAIEGAANVAGKISKGAKGAVEAASSRFGKPKLSPEEEMALFKGGTEVPKPAEASKVATDVAQETVKPVPDARIAGKMLDETTGKIVKDPVGLEAIKQGIPERDVANVKFGTATDKVKMNKMLDIAESASTNKRIVERSTDVVGDTYLDLAKSVAAKNKEAGTQLNMIADKLKGKSANITKPITNFLGEMENSGITLKGKTLNFKGSEFEGIPSAENAINNLWSRIQRFKGGEGDAQEIHRLKRYIDNVVEYGKTSEGLVGKAQNVLKGFRRGIDGVLDETFPAYNKANTVFADTISQLNDVNQVLGRRVKIGDQFANVKAGTAMRKLFSNIQGRGELLQHLDALQKVAQKYGTKIDQDIVTQANFADTIENIFGSEAGTSFLGQIQKGLGHAQEAANAVNDLSRGNVIGAGFRAGKSLLEHAKGISQVGKIKALRALIQDAAEKGTVFGKK